LVNDFPVSGYDWTLGFHGDEIRSEISNKPHKFAPILLLCDAIDPPDFMTPLTEKSGGLSGDTWIEVTGLREPLKLAVLS